MASRPIWRLEERTFCGQVVNVFEYFNTRKNSDISPAPLFFEKSAEPRVMKIGIERRAVKEEPGLSVRGRRERGSTGKRRRMTTRQ